jgi:branched-chain amino acid transport system permease protein
VLGLVQRRTKLGLAFRAVASNRQSSQLVGVPVRTVLALGWGIAGALGALAGVLVANNTLVSTTMMTRLLIFGLAAATVGGLDSPAGAAVGGLLLALFETMLGGYVPFIGGDVSLVAAIGALIVVLLVRPQGLFGRRTVSRL